MNLITHPDGRTQPGATTVRHVGFKRHGETLLGKDGNGYGTPRPQVTPPRGATRPRPHGLPPRPEPECFAPAWPALPANSLPRGHGSSLAEQEREQCEQREQVESIRLAILSAAIDDDDNRFRGHQKTPPFPFVDSSPDRATAERCVLRLCRLVILGLLRPFILSRPPRWP